MLSRINGEYIFIFLTGIGIGFILTVLFNEKTIDTKHPKIKYDLFVSKHLNKVNISTNRLKEVKKIRILCFLNTRPANHLNKAVHIRNTWHKHCDKLLFASTLTDVNLNALGFNVTDDHSHLWGKVKLMFEFIHNNFLNEYDWFFKGDDDTFLIPENLKFLLAAYSPEDPIYFGHKFNTSFHKWGYFSGGSGYVLSRKAVHIFVEQLLTNKSLCPIESDDRIEDMDISSCFEKVNVYPGDERDLLKRARFLPFSPEYHMFIKRGDWWYWQRQYYKTDEGLDCCSNYTISFHYIEPKNQYSMYYLTYLHKVFGIVRQFPPPPQKQNMTDVIKILELERSNDSYRGY